MTGLRYSRTMVRMNPAKQRHEVTVRMKSWATWNEILDWLKSPDNGVSGYYYISTGNTSNEKVIHFSSLEACVMFGMVFRGVHI